MADGDATDYHLIDLRHGGRPASVAAYVLESPDGLLVVDPGPSSTLPALIAGLAAFGAAPGDLRGILLTHIHLDHAGSAGTIARSNPGVRVYVHASGAPHVIDPAKLLASATRLYGDKMEALWGEVAPVPASRVMSLTGGERLAWGTRRLEVAYTPGHAWHHVSYFDSGSGVAFVGDTGGLKLPGMPLVLPVTPPPDFDLEAWLDSIERIAVFGAGRLALTHYGPWPDPSAHLAELADGLVAWSGYARESLAQPGTDRERLEWFVGRLGQWIEGRIDPDKARTYLAGAGPDSCWQGLVRYWRKKAPVG